MLFLLKKNCSYKSSCISNVKSNHCSIQKRKYYLNSNYWWLGSDHCMYHSCLSFYCSFIRIVRLTSPKLNYVCVVAVLFLCLTVVLYPFPAKDIAVLKVLCPVCVQFIYRYSRMYVFVYAFAAVMVTKTYSYHSDSQETDYFMHVIISGFSYHFNAAEPVIPSFFADGILLHNLSLHITVLLWDVFVLNSQSNMIKSANKNTLPPHHCIIDYTILLLL